MAAGDTENKLPVNPCCNAWMEKCSKLEKGRNYLRQSVKLLTESFDKIQTENKSLSAETETLAAANVSIEKHVSSLKSEILSLRENGVDSGNLNSEELNHLRGSIAECERKNKELTELVKIEKERANIELKRAEAAKKRADQASKQLSIEKEKVVQTEKQSLEKHTHKIEELNSKLNEAMRNVSSQAAELHETKTFLEAKERMLSEHRTLLDLSKKNEGKLTRLLEETQKNAQNEKSRADNLHVQVEHCKERIQTLQKQVEEIRAPTFSNKPVKENRTSHVSFSNNSTPVKRNSKKRRLIEESVEDNKKRIDEMEKKIQQLVSSKIEDSGKALQISNDKHLKGKMKHWKNQYKQAKQLAILEKEHKSALYKEFISLKVKVLDMFGHMDVIGKLFSNKSESIAKEKTEIAHKPNVRSSFRDTESISGIDSAKQIFHTSCSSDPEEQLFSFNNYMNMLDLDDPSEERRYREAIERPLSPSLPELKVSIDIFGNANDITHFLIASRTLISDWSALTEIGPFFTQLLISLKNASFSIKEKITVLFSILVHNFCRSPTNNAFRKLQSVLSDNGTGNMVWGMFSLHEFLSSVDDLLIQGNIKEYSLGANDTITSKSASKEQLLTGSAVLASFHASTNSTQYARAFCFNVLLSRVCDESAVAVLHVVAEICTEVVLRSNSMELMVLKSVVSFLEGKFRRDSVLPWKGCNSSVGSSPKGARDFVLCSKDCYFSIGSLPVETVVSKLLECSMSDDMCDVFSLLEVVAVRMGWGWTCHVLIPKVVEAVKCSTVVGFVVGSLALFGQLGRIGVESEGYGGEHVAILRTVLCEFLRTPAAESSFLIQLTAVSSVLEVSPSDGLVACGSSDLVRDWFSALSQDQLVVALELIQSLPHVNAKMFCKKDYILKF